MITKLRNQPYAQRGNKRREKNLNQKLERKSPRNKNIDEQDTSKMSKLPQSLFVV
jgi:hypothetical protein